MKTNRKQPRRGAATLKLALGILLILTVLIANVELGRGLMTQQVLINAVRKGARACVENGLTADETRALVKNYANKGLVPGINVKVAPDPATVEAGAPITVTAWVDFNDVSVLSPRYMADKAILATSTKRKVRDH